MKYRSEEDKSYGVAGMALGLSVFEMGDHYASITIDADGLDCIRFTPDFFFTGNPRVPAKASWKQLCSNYRVSVGLVLADAICRKMVLDHGYVNRKLRQQLLEAARTEGNDSCQLESDEVESLFDTDFSHLVKVFSNSSVHQAIAELARRLAETRSMSRFDVEEILHDFDLI